MKEAILEVLRRHPGEYLSGEELSRGLGVSRTAIWKHIQALREAGYQIDSQPRRGHCLLAVPDLLYPEEIRAGGRLGLFGREIHYLTEVGSTNETARSLAEEGAPEGTIVLAEIQTGGRGRLGRMWVSPFGKGIWMSLILRPPIAPPAAPHLTLAAAVAVARAVREVTGLPAGIKWPNDLLVNGRKVCGILTEMKAEVDAVHYIVVGIGINVNLRAEDLPPDVRELATSLMMELGAAVPRVRLAREVLSRLSELYSLYLQEGFPPVREAWKEMNITLGKRVKVSSTWDEYHGTAVDIDNEGALLVRGEDGQQRRFYAGDVTLRGS